MYKCTVNLNHYWLFEDQTISAVPEGKATLWLKNLDQKEPLIEIDYVDYEIRVSDKNNGTALLINTKVNKTFSNAEKTLDEHLNEAILKEYKLKPWTFNFEQVDETRERQDD